MANIVEGELRNSQEWFGAHLNEDGIVADVLKRVTADAVAVKRWTDTWRWKMPSTPFFSRHGIPEHAGCSMFGDMSIRNFYGLWHADNPHTVFGIDDGVNRCM